MRGVRRPSARLLIVVVALCVAAAGVGFLATRMVKSPAQVLAEAAPPPVTDITAPVEERQLSSTVALEGVVGPQAVVPVAAGALGQGDGAKVVTSMKFAAGEEVVAGDVLAEVNGRPVLVLPGEVPAYRGMSLNATGPDVEQLQSALRSLGYSVRPDKSGVFGAGTSAAVRRLYRDRGQPPSPGPALPAPEDPAAPAPDPGFQVPFGEVAFIAGLPARVSDVKSATGSVVSSAPLLELATGDLVLSGQIAQSSSALPAVGARVALLMAGGDRLQGSVVSIKTVEQTGEDQSGGQGFGGQGGGQQSQVIVKPDVPLPAAALGQRARMMVDLAAAPAPGLVVPVSAMFSQADGSSVVTVVREGGAKEQVPVAAGFSGDGFVAVVPQGGAALAVGDQVLVGRSAGGVQ